MASSMAKGNSTLETKEGKFMKVIGSMIKWKEWAFSNGQMETFMKVSLSKTSFLDMGYDEELTDRYLKVIGTKMKFMN